MAWTEDQKQAIIEAYEEPTPEEIVQMLSADTQEEEKKARVTPKAKALAAFTAICTLNAIVAIDGVPILDTDFAVAHQ